MPILILPNKLNHALGAQRRGRVLRMLGWMGGRVLQEEGGTVVNPTEQLSAWSDQDILGEESLIGWRAALVVDGFVAASHVYEKAMMAGN